MAYYSINNAANTDATLHMLLDSWVSIVLTGLSSSDQVYVYTERGYLGPYNLMYDIIKEIESFGYVTLVLGPPENYTKYFNLYIDRVKQYTVDKSEFIDR